jgi:hypothetical protein
MYAIHASYRAVTAILDYLYACIVYTHESDHLDIGHYHAQCHAYTL